MTAAAVVLVAHGTAHEPGRRTLGRLRDAVAARLPDRRVQLAYLDHARPLARDVCRARTDAVLVPLFLAAGYHVRSDVAALPGRPAPHLGVEPEVVETLLFRLPAEPVDTVVLAGAGSTDATARSELTLAAQELSRLRGRPVRAAVLGGPGPSVTEVVDDVQRRGRSVAVAPFLLAQGRLLDRLTELAEPRGVPVGAPLGAHPRVVDLVLRRVGAVDPQG